MGRGAWPLRRRFASRAISSLKAPHFWCVPLPNPGGKARSGRLIPRSYSAGSTQRRDQRVTDPVSRRPHRECAVYRKPDLFVCFRGRTAAPFALPPSLSKRAIPKTCARSIVPTLPFRESSGSKAACNAPERPSPSTLPSGPWDSRRVRARPSQDPRRVSDRGPCPTPSFVSSRPERKTSTAHPFPASPFSTPRAPVHPKLPPTSMRPRGSPGSHWPRPRTRATCSCAMRATLAGRADFCSD